MKTITIRPARAHLAAHCTPARCTDCMQGQGDYCECREPIDVVGVRWLVVGLVAFWAVVTIGLIAVHS